MTKFSLTVIKPVKGKPGIPMFTYDKHARNISEAVEAVRAELAGSGFIVVQSQSLARSKE